jgi:hypothetical protein
MRFDLLKANIHEPVLFLVLVHVLASLPNGICAMRC